MTDEKKGEKTPWIPVEKTISKTLPTDRPYTDAEAIISLELDRNSGKLVSVKGYVELWRWGYNRVYRLMEEHGFEVRYEPELTGKKKRGKVMKVTSETKRRESGDVKSKKSDKLQRNPERKRRASGDNYKELNNKRTDTNVSVKGSKDPLSAFSKKTRLEADRLFKKWNDVLQRRDPNGKQRVRHGLGTARHKKSLLYFCQLLNGTFFSAPDNVIDIEAMDEIGVTEEVRAAPMSLAEIEEGLALLNRLFEKEYWGKAENFYSWDLPSLILHPKKGTSLFFQCVYTDMVKQESFKRIDPRFEEYAKEMPEQFRAQVKKLAPSIEATEKWYKDQIKQGVRMEYGWATPEIFVLDFLDWVAKEKDWLDGPPHPRAVRPGGKFFEEYLDFYEEEKHAQFVRDDEPHA